VLHQYGGVDADIAAEVIGIVSEGCSLIVRKTAEEQALEDRLAFERGDTPDMPRQEGQRRAISLAVSPDEPAAKVAGLGQKPVAAVDEMPF
jgi:hypothetical protein